VETALVEPVPAPVETDEPELMKLASGGDSRAFATLVERYMRRAYYVALGLTGSHEDALDLSQEAFARAFRARHRLDPTGSFYAWLYQILRRLCFNFNRDRRSRRTKLSEARPWLLARASAEAAEHGPEATVAREETIHRVRAAIEELPDREREILVLREFEGLSYRDIAELLGIPIGTVMSRLYTARRHLARVIEEETRERG